MKITIENNTNTEVEIVIRGDATSDKVRNLIDLLSGIHTEKISKMIITRKDEKEFVLPINEIEFFQSSNGISFVFYKGNEYKTNLKLFEIEQLYSNYGFLRISKSTIINCNHIKYLEVEFSGNYTVVTISEQKMTISRRYVSRVKKYIREEM